MTKSPLHFTIAFIVFCLVFALIATLFIVTGIFSFKHLDDNDKIFKSVVRTIERPTIIIDAGHGGEDGGAVSADGSIEKDINLQISFLLSDMLKASGTDVIMTRTEDILLYDRNVDFKGHKKSLDLRARLDIAEQNPDAIFVSVHMNAFPSKKYSGLQVYYSKNTNNSKILADKIQDNTKRLLQPENDRKAKAAGSSIFLLNRAPGTAVLIECGFLSNTEECLHLNDENYRRKLAFVLFLSLIDFSAENNG